MMPNVNVSEHKAFRELDMIALALKSSCTVVKRLGIVERLLILVTEKAMFDITCHVQNSG